jgi:pimeloyl-ACP methyl ester carboxylesterase
VSAFQRPTLLITGSGDGVSPAARLDDIASAFQTVGTAVIDGVGHWTSIEATLDVNRLLGEFLAVS